MQRLVQTRIMILLAIIILTGCFPNPSPTPIPSSTPLESTRITASPTSYPTATLTRTPGFTTRPSSTPTITLTPTLSPTFTLTPIPGPTLSDVESEQWVREMLRTKGGCRLPCWWGMVPGENTWGEVKQALGHYGLPWAEDYFMKDGRILHESDMDLEIPRMFLTFIFYDLSGVLDSITVDIHGYYDPMGFQELWQMYSLQQIMLDYEQPSQIWVRHTHPDAPGTRYGYIVWLQYEGLGFVIQYEGVVSREDTLSHICPSFQSEEGIDSLLIYMQSPSNPRSLDVLSGLDEEKREVKILSIEEATGLSLVAFYQLVVQQGNEACFTTPLDKWREP